MDSITHRVPATSANLGPGYACLGVALRIYNRVTVRRGKPAGKAHPMAAKAAQLFFERAERKPFDFDWTITGDVPQSRGLGSSVVLRLAFAGRRALFMGDAPVATEAEMLRAYDVRDLRFVVHGFTSDGKQLIMSDGSSSLRFLDPETQKQTATLAVSWQGQPVRYLNELEWAKGFIYANVWYSPLIARIDPKTGNVTDWINMAALVSHNTRNSDMVLNGIAWDAKTGLLYVTGKNWPLIYALRLES